MRVRLTATLDRLTLTPGPGKTSVPPAIPTQCCSLDRIMVLFIVRPLLNTGLSLLFGTTISLFSFAACFADPEPVIHYSPVENLKYTDSTLIDRAEHNIDFAAYVLTDWPVMRALIRAAGSHGAHIFRWKKNRRAGACATFSGIARDTSNRRTFQAAKISFNAPKRATKLTDDGCALAPQTFLPRG